MFFVIKYLIRLKAANLSTAVRAFRLICLTAHTCCVLRWPQIFDFQAIDWIYFDFGHGLETYFGTFLLLV